MNRPAGYPSCGNKQHAGKGMVSIRQVPPDFAPVPSGANARATD